MIPVFIGGCARSGTTLLGAMLGTHSECLCIPELPFKIDVFRYKNENLHFFDIFKRIKKLRRFRIWGLDIKDSLPLYSTSNYPEIIDLIIKNYAKKTGKSSFSIWVDHTPGNIKYSDILLKLYPDAKMIHIVRDGRAVAASIMPLDWGPNTIDKAAHFWIKRISYGISSENQWKDRIIRIRYEDLVAKTDLTLKFLCSFLNIDYQPEMINGDGFNVPPYSLKQHSLVGKKPDIMRINAWEGLLKPRQIEIFESLAGDLLLSLGYILKYGFEARKMTVWEKILFNTQEKYKRKIINRIRYGLRIKKGIREAMSPET